MSKRKTSVRPKRWQAVTAALALAGLGVTLALTPACTGGGGSAHVTGEHSNSANESLEQLRLRQSDRLAMEQSQPSGPWLESRTAELGDIPLLPGTFGLGKDAGGSWSYSAAGGVVAGLPRSDGGSSGSPGPFYNFNPRSSGVARELTDNSVVAGVEPAPEPRLATELTSVFDPAEELWIIVEPGQPLAAPKDPEMPGSGALVALMPVPGGDEWDAERIPVPLEHTEVSASVTGHVASVNVKQTFHNPHQAKIEAVYVFPLPQNAAVNGFLMTVGDRTIRGIIREREEAQRIYNVARANGHVASLLEQQRPNIFMQKVANIEPDRSIDIDITYFHTTSYSDGWFEFVFPMVVGPRFNPPATLAKGEGVVAAPRGPGGQTGQQTEVQYLHPTERSGHDIGLTLDIHAGVPIEDVVSVNHRVEVAERTGGVVVKLAEGDTIPNKDFVLRYKVAADEVRGGLIVVREGETDGGFFTLMLVPPDELASTERTPLELVFVLDCSGSMSGKPIEQSKLAMRTALERLDPRDTFQIIRFSDNASSFGRTPVPATPRNIADALRYVEGLNGSGGTMMVEGIKAALDFPHDEHRLRFVTFLTDGYIGNEGEILAAMQEKIGPSRVFSFGVGSSPNRYLMDRMAKVGQGVAAYISLQSDGDEVMGTFFDRIAHASMTDVTPDFGPLRGVEFFPGRLPDLFSGRPVVVTGRFESGYDALMESGDPSVAFAGRVGGKMSEIRAGVSDLHAPDAAALDAVWARAKIEQLATRQATQDRDESGAIESLALAHGLMSAYTSFVAVDSSRVTEGDVGYTVTVPVPVPDGVRYETTVGR